MTHASRPTISRRRILTSIAAGIAGVGVYRLGVDQISAASLAVDRPHRLYVIDHLTGRIVMTSGSGMAIPPSEVVVMGEALTGYASKFVYRSPEPIALFFPAPGVACAGYRDGGCAYGNVVSLPSRALGPGLYRCRYFEGGVAHETVFSVIDPATSPEICLVYPTSTYQAYNKAGGESLYSTGTLEASVVSMRRPLGVPKWYHDPRRNHADAILHRMGHAFSAIDSVALHEDPGILDGVHLLVLAQHDEYWSFEMRRHVEAHLRRGGNLLCLAGNVMFWKVQFANDNVLLKKINPRSDEDAIETWTGRWDRIRPEEQTTGLAWRFGGYPVKREFISYEALADKLGASAFSRQEYAASDGVQVLLPQHPVFAGTGLARNATFGVESELLSVEIDGLPMTADMTIDRGRAKDAPPGIRALTTGHAARVKGLRRIASMVDFRFEGKGRVINVGTIGWLNAAHVHGDDTVRTITGNAVGLLLEDAAANLS